METGKVKRKWKEESVSHREKLKAGKLDDAGPARNLFCYSRQTTIRSGHLDWPA
jgi:hypothetical protein